MADFITALLTSVTLTTLWETLEPAAPLVGIGILFGFGYMVLRRTVRGISRGKAKL
jgi:hypothetical protein